MIKKLLLVLLINFTIVSVSCGGNMAEKLSKEQIKEKWDATLMSSSESWWYAGSENGQTIIAIKKPFQTKIYSVGSKEFKLLEIEEFEFTEKEEKWVNIKENNVSID